MVGWSMMRSGLAIRGMMAWRTPAFHRQRMLSTPSKPSGGIDPSMLNQKSKEAAEQAKALGKKSWRQWVSEHSDELQVVVLWGVVLVTSLQTVRQKGEHREKEKILEARIAELEGQAEKLKQDIKSTVSDGVEKVASDLGVGYWGGKAKKTKDLHDGVLGLIEQGIKKATYLPAPGEAAVQPKSEDLAESKYAGLEVEKPRPAGGLI